MVVPCCEVQTRGYKRLDGEATVHMFQLTVQPRSQPTTSFNFQTYQRRRLHTSPDLSNRLTPNLQVFLAEAPNIVEQTHWIFCTSALTRQFPGTKRRFQWGTELWATSLGIWVENSRIHYSLPLALFRWTLVVSPFHLERVFTMFWLFLFSGKTHKRSVNGMNCSPHCGST